MAKPRVFLSREIIMLSEFFKALSLIFIAEMGDKTQIIAMTFATQFMVSQVLLGVSIGVIANHGLAILLGSLLGTMLPLDMIQLLAGVLFIFFGYNSLKPGDEEGLSAKRPMNPVIAVALAFFVGELGDKTQLTALALSAEAVYPAVILLGTTTGMIATSGMGIFVGSKLGRRIPENSLKAASSVVFVSFGLQKIYVGLKVQGFSVIIAALVMMSLILVEIYLLLSFRKIAVLGINKAPMKEAAQLLYEKTVRVKDTVDDLCLGEGICGTCVGTNCLMGYTKDMLNKAKEEKNYYKIDGIDLESLLVRDYEKSKVEGAYMLTLKELGELGWPADENFVMNKAREVFEFLLFGKVLSLAASMRDQMSEIKTLDPSLFKKIEKFIGSVN